MNKTIYFMSVFFLFLVSSCKNFSSNSFYSAIADSCEEKIELELPDWPPEDCYKSYYPPLSKWKIVVSSEKYSCSLVCSTDSSGKVLQSVSANGITVSDNIISISAPKNKPLSVTVHPVTLNYYEKLKSCSGKDVSETLFFKPGGFIYPYDFSPESNSNRITWNNGFVSTLMENMFKNKNYTRDELNDFISHFNWKKASELVNNKINDISKPYNPWLLNMGKIIEKICLKKASSIYFNLSSTDSVNIKELINYDNENVLSSFIPENSVIGETGNILLKKQNKEIILTTSGCGIMCNYFSTNKVSLEYIFLPIYIEEI